MAEMSGLKVTAPLLHTVPIDRNPQGSAWCARTEPTLLNGTQQTPLCGEGQRPMKPHALICSLCIALSGCGIGGFWMNGDPSYKPDTKPYIAYWKMDGMTEESRRGDSAECGASQAPAIADDVMFPAEALNAERTKTDANELAAFWRLRRNWSQCMESKGYRYGK